MTLIAIVKNEDIVALTTKSKVKEMDEKLREEVNEQDEFGNTALHYAMKSGNWYIIKFLLDHNADMFKENKEGVSALQMAKPDSIRRICVEMKMKEKPKSEMKEKPKLEIEDKQKTDKDEKKRTLFDDGNANIEEIVENMGFSSNTIRLKNGIEKHSELIANRLKETKNRLSKVLVNVCNEDKCFNSANCLYSCGHIIFCTEHGKGIKKCPYCNKDIKEYYDILPIV